MTQRRFVILDRDGTIIVERNYLSDPDDVELIPRMASGLRQLSDMGLGLIVLTNQSAIGRGYFDETRLNHIHQRLYELLDAEGIFLDAIYFCPHTPSNECSCRKPKTGLLIQAAQEHDFDPKDCFVVGDKACDIELGQRVGARTFLVRTGYGVQVASDNTNSPDYVVDDVLGAAQVIGSLLGANVKARIDGTEG